jgi:hypothetical protein
LKKAWQYANGDFMQTGISIAINIMINLNTYGKPGDL